MTATSAELFVRERGAGPLVVLVHGTMDRSTAFARVMGELDGFHTVAYDRRGYARSASAGSPAATVDAGADDLLAVIAAAGGAPACAVGHSLGGHIALAAALSRPDVVTSAVVWEAPLAWADWWPGDSAGGLATQAPTPADAAEGFMRRLAGDHRWETLPAATRDARRSEGPALLADLGAIRTGTAPYDLAAVAVPVVVGHGSASKPYHQRSARHMAETIADAELVVIDGASHGAHTSHPAEFARLIRRAAPG